MHYTIETDISNTLITVTYSESTTFQDRVASLVDIISILESHPKFDILVDVSQISVHMNSDQQISYGELIAGYKQQLSQSKIAILAESQKLKHPLIPASMYALGLHNICEFDNKIDALNWLDGTYR